MRILLPLLLLVTAGCWQPRYFTPRERLTGESPSGELAAMYEFTGGDGAVGEIRVWSRGAQARYVDDDQEVIDLHVGFELENNGQAPLRVEPGSVVLQDLTIDGYLQGPLLPHEVRGGGLAPSGGTSRLDIIFRPAADAPRKIESFSVRFAVETEQEVVLAQVTPFGPAGRRGRAYDPWLDGPYYAGPGWGWGWGWGGVGGWGGGWGYGRWGPGWAWPGRYWW